MLYSACTDEGELLDAETARRLLSLPGRALGPLQAEPPEVLATSAGERQAAIQREIAERNARFFEAESEKLDGWADDLKAGLEREIKELDRQIKEARRLAKAAPTLEEKLAGQKQVKQLESQRHQKRRTLFDAQDEVDVRRESLIAAIEAKLAQRVEARPLVHVHWRLG